MKIDECEFCGPQKSMMKLISTADDPNKGYAFNLYQCDNCNSLCKEDVALNAGRIWIDFTNKLVKHNFDMTRILKVDLMKHFIKDPNSISFESTGRILSDEAFNRLQEIINDPNATPTPKLVELMKSIHKNDSSKTPS